MPLLGHDVRMSAPQPGPETWSPTAAYGTSSPVPARRSPLAVTAFVSGVVTVLVGGLASLALPLVLSSGYDPTAVGLLQFARGTLTGLLALVATVTGTVALVRRQPGTGLASAGTALGASALFGLVSGLVQGALYQVF